MEDKLISCINNVDPTWYYVKKNTLYHDLISLVISQRISFKLSRQIRDSLKKEHEKLTGHTFFIPTIIKEKIKDYIKNEKVLECINHITQRELNGTLDIDSIRDIKGIGDWTYKALLIMNHKEDKGIFLKEDAWIRKRLAQLVFNEEKDISQKDAENIVKGFPIDCLTQISLFLWRIKQSGINNIREDIQLSRDDFI